MGCRVFYIMKLLSRERVETKSRWIWTMWGLEYPAGIDFGGEEWVAEYISKKEGGSGAKIT